MDTVDFSNYIDLDNPEHMREVVDYFNKGFWRNGFIPKNVKMDSLWITNLVLALAKRYVADYTVRNYNSMTSINYENSEDPENQAISKNS